LHDISFIGHIRPSFFGLGLSENRIRECLGADFNFTEIYMFFAIQIVSPLGTQFGAPISFLISRKAKDVIIRD
jgi:hypothetical protein